MTQQSAKAAFKGIITATAETSADVGALRVADNLTLRRQNALTPRQGFVPDALGFNATGSALLASHVLGNYTWYETGAAGGFILVVGGLPYGAQLQTPFTGTQLTTPVRVRADIRDSAALRGSLYVPFSFAVGKLNSQAQANFAFAPSGIPPTVAVSTNTNANVSGILAPNTQVAYRLVLKKTDFNGVVVRSRPTGAVLISNTSGSNVDPLVNHYVNSGAGADEVEIYRTRMFPTSIQVDDEMQLVATIKPGFGVQYVDRVADIARSTTLYTSPSRGGMENANDPPPACACIEPFKQSLFFGNTRGPQRFILSFSWANVTGSATGTGYRTATGNVTNGSNQITGVSNTTGLQQGMVLTRISVSQTALWVTNISGSTVTLSSNYTGSTAAGVALTFSDAVELGGQWWPLGSEPNSSANLPFALLQMLAPNLAYTLTPAAPGWATTVVIESGSRDVGSFTLRATHGGEVYPALPLYGAATTTVGTSSQDVLPNGVQWTSPDEPEHAPPKFTAQVGDKAKAILGMVATREAMFILKEDGIWRVTGTNGNFTFTPFDLTTFCILPSSVRRLDNAFYMLSNKGIVQVDDNGVVVLSEPIRPLVTRLIDDIRTNFASTSLYALTGMAGTASSVDSRNNEYLLSLGTVTTEPSADVLVYNALSDGFTTFSFNKTADAFGFVPTGYGVRHDDGVQVLHTGGARIANYARLTIGAESLPIVADGSQAITATVVTTNVAVPPTLAFVTFTPSTALAVGDVLVQGSFAYRVAQVNSGTQVTVLTNVSSGIAYPATLPTTGAMTVYRSIACKAEPHGFTTPEMLQKLWTHSAWAFSRLVGPGIAEATYTSATPNVDLTSQATTQLLETPLQAGYMRFTAGTLLRHPIPTVHRRGWLIRFSLALGLAFGDFLLEIVTAEAREDIANKRGTHGTGAT